MLPSYIAIVYFFLSFEQLPPWFRPSEFLLMNAIVLPGVSASQFDFFRHLPLRPFQNANQVRSLSCRSSVLQDTVCNSPYYSPDEGLVCPQAKGKKQALVYVSGRSAECSKGVDSGATPPGSNPACATCFPRYFK